MADSNTIARSVRDLALANWFGGSLMGAVGLNGAAGAVDDPVQRSRVPAAGWQRWTPLEAASVIAVVAADTVLLRDRRGKLVAQQGVARNTAIKLAVNGVATAATIGTWVLGRRLGEAGDIPVRGATEPTAGTPEPAARSQRGLRVLQWVVPALTGTHMVMNAVLGEQERPRAVAAGIAQRAGKLLPALAVPAAVATAVAVVRRRQRRDGGGVAGQHTDRDGGPGVASTDGSAGTAGMPGAGEAFVVDEVTVVGDTVVVDEVTVVDGIIVDETVAVAQVDQMDQDGPGPVGPVDPLDPGAPDLGGPGDVRPVNPPDGPSSRPPLR